MISMAGINKLFVLGCILWSSLSYSQLIHAGKITYTRRTNLFKVIDDERMQKWIGENNKIKIEKFTLFFNDTASLYAFVQPEQPDPQAFFTIKNSVYNVFPKNQRNVYMDMMGSQMTVVDTLVKHTWKMTDKTRNIAGYECTRVIWRLNDSTRVYAWYTTDIVPSVGPENIQGLPGAVLGLATEDGGVVYFAEKVEALTPTPEQIAEPKKKGKTYTEAELRAELTKKLEGQPYGKRIIDGLFAW